MSTFNTVALEAIDAECLLNTITDKDNIQLSLKTKKGTVKQLTGFSE
jgi:hypothetical protein